MKMLTLFLMTQKGLRVLEALCAEYSGLVAAVITSRDESTQEDCYDEIMALSERTGIDCFDRKDCPAVETEYALAISWRWLIPAGGTRLMVVHDSLLPKYRGFNPLVTALINGDPEIGATALWAAEEYDRGDIIGQRSVLIEYPIRIREAIYLMSDLYVSLVREIADTLIRADVPCAIPQDEREASYSLWRDDLDYRLNWELASEQLKRQIDAQSHPYLGAEAEIDGQRVRILSAECIEDVQIANRSCGKVIFLEAGLPVVVCGAGLLRITEAVWRHTGQPALPLKRFRTRFN